MMPFYERLMQADAESLSPRLREIRDCFLLMEEAQAASLSGAWVAAEEKKAQLSERLPKVQPWMEDLSYRLEFVPDPSQTPEYNTALRQIHEYAFRTLDGKQKDLMEIGRDMGKLEETARFAGVEQEWQAFALKFTQLTARHQRATALGQGGGHGWAARTQTMNGQRENHPISEARHYALERVEALENMMDIIASRLSGQEVTQEALAQLHAPIRTSGEREAEMQMVISGSTPAR